MKDSFLKTVGTPLSMAVLALGLLTLSANSYAWRPIWLEPVLPAEQCTRFQASTLVGGNGEFGYVNGYKNVYTIASNGGTPRFVDPREAVADGQGNLYVLDYLSENGKPTGIVIRKIGTTPVITPDPNPSLSYKVSWFAGSTSLRGNKDGPLESALFEEGTMLAGTPSGVLFAAKYNGTSIRKIEAGIVSTLTINTPNIRPLVDVRAINADAKGNLYVADKGRILKLTRSTTNASIYTAAVIAGGNGNDSGLWTMPAEGPGPEVWVYPDVGGIVTDSVGNVYFSNAQTIRKISFDSDGKTTRVSTLAGVGSITSTYAYDLDGLGRAARFMFSPALTIDKENNLYVRGNGTVRRVRTIAPFEVKTLIGGINHSQHGAPMDPTHVNGSGSSARLLGGSLAYASNGSLYLVEPARPQTFDWRGIPENENQGATVRDLSCEQAANPSSYPNVTRPLIAPETTCAGLTISGVSNTDLSFAAGGGAQSISVKAPDKCSWEIEPIKETWVKLDKVRGTGSQTVVITVAANSGEARSTAVSMRYTEVSSPSTDPATFVNVVPRRRDLINGFYVKQNARSAVYLRAEEGVFNTATLFYYDPIIKGFSASSPTSLSCSTSGLSGKKLNYWRSEVQNSKIILPGGFAAFLGFEPKTNWVQQFEVPANLVSGEFALADQRLSDSDNYLVRLSNDPCVDAKGVPTMPTDLRLSRLPAGSNVDLVWWPSKDNVKVVGYQVYRDGIMIGKVTGPFPPYDGTNIAFTDTKTVLGKTYSYTVRAYDYAENLSAPSAVLTVKR